MSYDKYWIIHNKVYDMTDFIKNHPGGEHTILLGRGRDCTELFESVHGMANSDKLNNILNNYYIKNKELENDQFDWSNNIIHNEIRSEVKKLFKNKSYKANKLFIMKVIVILLMWFGLYYYGIKSMNIGLIFLSGIMWSALGFCIMHDGSHSALSKNYLVNWLCSMIWNNFSLWNNTAWMLHHIYGHHSYTGIAELDPDLNYDIILKSENQKDQNYGPIYKYQHYYSWILLSILPNQFLSVALNYRFFKNIYGLDWLGLEKYQKNYVNIINIFSIILLFGIPLYIYKSLLATILINFVYFTGIGITFFIFVLPNHDSLAVRKNQQYFKEYKKDMLKDWSVQQIISSANFSNSNSIIDIIVTQLFGGMNYQIEHHLFPTVCHIYYPEISNVIKRICHKYQIPYVSRKNIFECVKEYYQLLKLLSEYK